MKSSRSTSKLGTYQQALDYRQNLSGGKNVLLDDELFEMRDCGIANPMTIEVPKSWSQTACNILADKYIRKAGVPSKTRRITVKNKKISSDKRTFYKLFGPSTPTKDAQFGAETSVRQVINRLAGAWTYWGWEYGYFIDRTQATIFYKEVAYLLLNQMIAPNSPQWFNTGLNWAYGINGEAQGHYHTDLNGNIIKAEDAYTRPQPSACFIQSVDDDLTSQHGIMGLWSKESLLFKYGSGTGTNFSKIRGKGEPLSGGGTSSGLMSFLKIGDVAAGSIKSGGTTRRAAKMVVLDVDHPEIEDFVNWKRREENKVAYLVEGSKKLREFAEGCYNRLKEHTKLQGKAAATFSENDREVQYELRAAQKQNLPLKIVTGIVELVNSGMDLDLEEIDFDWQGEGYMTVSGQNSNNSVSVTDNFLEAAKHHEEWNLINRTDGGVHSTINAFKLWQSISYNAWSCADPGVHYRDTINKWHTCKADGDINASNPCSEYLFLDNTACNLASINLKKCLDYNKYGVPTFNFKSFELISAIGTLILDISVSMGQYPTKEIAEGSANYRTLGLGFANIGGMLMSMGIPYDSKTALEWGAVISSIMHGIAYQTSAELSDRLGTFPKYADNKKSMLEVIELHANAAKDLWLSDENDEDFRSPPSEAFELQMKIWDGVIKLGKLKGFRNAQVTVIAPTGTIGLLMDCDTTGIEPDFSLVKFKSLAGGGSMNIVNQSLPDAIRSIIFGNQAKATVVDQEFIDEILEKITAEINRTDGFPDLKSILERNLAEKHMRVFECANDIRPEGHINMMGAVQPFISGAISKTINMPMSATVDDIREVYEKSHKLGLKAVAIYRDGSKFSQPLNHLIKDEVKDDFYEDNAPEGWIYPKGQTITRDEYPELFKALEVMDDSVEDSINTDDENCEGSENQDTYPEPERRRLPTIRNSKTIAVNIGGHKLYLHVGEYENGDPGEIFINMRKEGTTLGSMMNNFAVAISLGLQYGVPLQEFIDAFVGTKSEPAGFVQGHPYIRNCTSIGDFIIRHLAIEYLQQDEFAHVKPKRAPKLPTPEPTLTLDEVFVGPHGLTSKEDGIIPLKRLIDAYMDSFSPEEKEKFKNTSDRAEKFDANLKAQLTIEPPKTLAIGDAHPTPYGTLGVVVSIDEERGVFGVMETDPKLPYTDKSMTSNASEGDGTGDVKTTPLPSAGGSVIVSAFNTEPPLKMAVNESYLQENGNYEAVASVGGFLDVVDARKTVPSFYESEPCSNCSGYTLVRNGTCMVCRTCGETTGCS